MALLLYPVRLLIASVLRMDMADRDTWMRAAVREGYRDESALSLWRRWCDARRVRILLLERRPPVRVRDVALAVAIGVAMAWAGVYGWPL